MMKHQGFARLFRFVVVGGGFACGYAVLTAILVGPAGLPVYATSVTLYALCIPVAFFVQMHVTFGLRQTRAIGFLLYAATQIVSLAMVTAITTQLVTGAFFLDTLVFLGSAGVAAVMSYLICSRLAFRPLD